MASTKRKQKARPAPKKKKYVQVIEGEVTADDEDGVVLWDFIPDEGTRLPAHGFSTGGLLDAHLCGKRVRVTIEEL